MEGLYFEKAEGANGLLEASHDVSCSCACLAYFSQEGRCSEGFVMNLTDFPNFLMENHRLQNIMVTNKGF